MSVMRYFARNSLIRLAVFSIGVLASFLVTPHMLRCLGESAYGVWSLISALLGYFLLFDFGMLQAVSQKSSVARVQNDQKALQRIFCTALYLGGIGFLGTLAAGGVLAFFAERFTGATIGHTPLALSIVIFSASAAVQLLLRSAYGLLAGAMRWTLLAFIAMLRTLLSSAAILFLVTETATPAENLLRVSMIISALNTLEPLILFFIARREVPIHLWPSFFSRTEAKALLRFGAPLLVGQLGELLRNRTQLYVVASVLGAAQVAQFSIARQLINYMSNSMMNAFGIMSPYFSRMQAEGDSAGYKVSLKESLLLSYTVSSFIGLCLIFYGAMFLSRWLGPQFSATQEILTPLAFAGIINFGEYPASGFLIGVGRHHILAVYSVTQGLLITLCSIPAAWVYGTAGVAWTACIFTLLYSFFLIPQQVAKASGIPLLSYYTTCASALLPQICMQGLYGAAVQTFLKPDYFTLFWVSSGHACIAAITLCLTLLWRRRHRKTALLTRIAETTQGNTP